MAVARMLSVLVVVSIRASNLEGTRIETQKLHACLLNHPLCFWTFFEVPKGAFRRCFLWKGPSLTDTNFELLAIKKGGWAEAGPSGPQNAKCT